MKMSQLFTKTTKNVPADEASKNARLLIQAGFIHKDSAGVYAMLPLGLMVLNNIIAVIREEMNAIGGQEVLMTTLQRQDLWERTDRWDDEKVDVWFKSKLKNDTEVGFGWSHEEQMTEMMRNFVSSYRDLPRSVYQFQNKLRNETRAKSGIMRTREFIMKDLYSFARSDEEHEAFYEQAKAAYTHIFERLGLGEWTYLTVASGGAFAEFSHEFQTRCEAGEDRAFRAVQAGIVFNEEIAPAKAPMVQQEGVQQQPMQEVEGKDLIGVEPLAKFLNIPVELTTKTMLFEDENGRVIAAAVRGGYDVNEHKLRKVVGAKSLKLAKEEVVRRVTGAEVGYAGLLNLPEDVQVVVDESCAGRVNFEMGANHTHYHSINVNWGRDLPEPKEFVDIKTAREGDAYPESGEVYEVFTVAEVGNIFSLGTSKSEPLDLKFSDEQGVKKPVVMGSYGIGPARVMGVIVEKYADDKGIVWPKNIAPYLVYLIRLGEDDAIKQAADELYDELTAAGVLVLYDDRIDTRAGEKFADADLLGIPYRMVISSKTLANNQVEVKERTSVDSQMIERSNVINMVVHGKAA